MRIFVESCLTGFSNDILFSEFVTLAKAQEFCDDINNVPGSCWAHIVKNPKGLNKTIKGGYGSPVVREW